MLVRAHQPTLLLFSMHVSPQDSSHTFNIFGSACAYYDLYTDITLRNEGNGYLHRL